MRIYFLSFITACVVLASCQRKEVAVAPHDPGSVTTATVNMGTPYKYQVYFSLKANTVVGQNLKTAWDIGCEPTTAGYHIVLNSSKSMFAFKTTKTDFASITMTDTTGFSGNKKWDAPSGNLDSTAIGNWQADKAVYVVDKGYDENGAWQGMEKMQMLSVSDTSYNIHFAAIDGTNEATISVKKDSSYNLAFISFKTQAQVTIEPPKATWDIVFSQYTYIFYDYNPPLPYLVTGCLLNRYNTTAFKDTADLFPQISYANVGDYKLKADISTIGYDWKTFTGTSYTINTAYNYIIQTADGRYYKMYFVGFYNSSGAEGNPKWEYQQL